MLEWLFLESKVIEITPRPSWKYYNLTVDGSIEPVNVNDTESVSGGTIDGQAGPQNPDTVRITGPIQSMSVDGTSGDDGDGSLSIRTVERSYRWFAILMGFGTIFAGSAIYRSVR